MLATLTTTLTCVVPNPTASVVAIETETASYTLSKHVEPIPSGTTKIKRSNFLDQYLSQRLQMDTQFFILEIVLAAPGSITEVFLRGDPSD